jgi:hypothetical protein
MEKKSIPADKPSLKSRGKKLNDGMAIGMPEDHKGDEGSSSLKKAHKGNDK